MNISWQELPATTASPDALIGAAAMLERTAHEVGTTGRQVSGILYSGVPDFSGLLGPPIMNRSSEHGVWARNVQHLLRHAARVTELWASDVTEYLARCSRTRAAAQQAFEALGYPPPAGEALQTTKAFDQQASDLVAWFEARAALRRAQLSDGPTPARQTELGQPHEAPGGLACGQPSPWPWVDHTLNAGGGVLGGVDALDGLPRWLRGVSGVLGPVIDGIGAGLSEYQDRGERSILEVFARGVFRGSAVTWGAGAVVTAVVGAMVGAPAVVTSVAAAVVSVAASRIIDRVVVRVFDEFDYIQDAYRAGGNSGPAAVIGSAVAVGVDMLGETSPGLKLALPGFARPGLSMDECVPSLGEQLREPISEMVEQELESAR